ncbi:MAG: coniferyl-alcohol dehydrogenase [Azospirillaceae bacterium]|nr:coniferyl-alcohol dehydrogenase [Azospirillaceae bacterium]
MQKRAVVTGAASGIGLATAKLLQQEGWHVIGLDRHAPETGVDDYVPVDLADIASIEAAIDALDGQIDALCNVAGLPPTAGAVPTMQVNFFGLRHLTERLLPKLADRASIVNVASLAGAGWPQAIDRAVRLISTGTLANAPAVLSAEGVTDENCYFVSKECVILWTLQSWNRWRDRGIRMNAVSPGPVMTPIHKDFLATLGERAEKDRERSERPAKPSEIAPAIVFLCREESRWIRATNLASDDGLFAAALQDEFGF